jgi:transcription initiation factor TFIIB
MASALGLPRNVRETAAVVYRDAVDKNLIRGRSIEGVAAAALYAACRQCSVPRTLDEIAEVSRVSRKEIGRISRELGLKLLPTSPIDYVPRFCSGLTLKGEVQSRAVEILRQAGERELTSGRGPTGVAAAAIYISSILGGERRTQREVAEVAGVTEVTIRNRYKELAEKLDIEIIL